MVTVRFIGELRAPSAMTRKVVATVAQRFPVEGARPNPLFVVAAGRHNIRRCYRKALAAGYRRRLVFHRAQQRINFGWADALSEGTLLRAFQVSEELRQRGCGQLNAGRIPAGANDDEILMRFGSAR